MEICNQGQARSCCHFDTVKEVRAMLLESKRCEDPIER